MASEKTDRDDAVERLDGYPVCRIALKSGRRVGRDVHGRAPLIDHNVVLRIPFRQGAAPDDPVQAAAFNTSISPA